VKQVSPEALPGNLRVFLACLLSFTILITPFAAIAAPRGVSTPTASGAVYESGKEANTTRSSLEDLFVNPPKAMPAAVLPGPVPEPAPQPLAPPVVGPVTATMSAAIVATANNGDGKADPGDTINYTVQLANPSGADATNLSFNSFLDSHTTFVGGSIKSTPVCFDQSVNTNEDVAKAITLTGEDPDGDGIFADDVTYWSRF